MLVVGAGNSGADIALEVSRSHPTCLSGRDKGHVPFRIESRRARVLLPLLWLVAGAAGLVLRRPRGALLAIALALGALILVVFNALMIYTIIAFAIPLAPALIVFGAAGLVGERSQTGR